MDTIFKGDIMLGKLKKIATQGSQAFMNYNAVKGAALFSPALGVAAPMVDFMNLAGTEIGYSKLKFKRSFGKHYQLHSEAYQIV